ncbi:Ubiquitin carboxyl-terminal hydrolase [Trichinella spiralis]|uniref:Ubiquitin carboxyl-terminal hydrolase n=1 Tax=Trichinella spiralis TaxID=6334 RepID=A0ABR3K4Q5_TRISP
MNSLLQTLFLQINYERQYIRFQLNKTILIRASPGWNEEIDSFVWLGCVRFIFAARRSGTLQSVVGQSGSKMKDTPVNGVIPQLFEGKMKSYVRCKKVPFESNREEAFYDIQLNVKGKANIYESFKDYVAVETLEGDNNTMRAIMLMRVQYDPLNDQNLKINDRFEFPEKLDLMNFLNRKNLPQQIYINPKGNGRWCKFDDDVVSRCSKSEAIEQNYGGNDSESAHRHCTNAYMLAYIRDSVMGKNGNVPPLMKRPIDEVDIPVQLRARLQRERDVEALRKKEKSEAHLFCTVFVLSDDDFEVTRTRPDQY